MSAALRGTREGRALRSEDGFGLIELTIAMAMLAVALLALVAALSSGIVTLQRVGRRGHRRHARRPADGEATGR